MSKVSVTTLQRTRMQLQAHRPHCCEGTPANCTFPQVHPQTPTCSCWFLLRASRSVMVSLYTSVHEMVTAHCTLSRRAATLAYSWCTQRASRPSCSDNCGCRDCCCCGDGDGGAASDAMPELHLLLLSLPLLPPPSAPGAPGKCSSCWPWGLSLPGGSGVAAAVAVWGLAGVLLLVAASSSAVITPCMPAMMGPQIVCVLPEPVWPKANTACRTGTKQQCVSIPVRSQSQSVCQATRCSCGCNSCGRTHV